MEIESTFEPCLDRIRQAWDAGDAHAYAEQFTGDATYVIFMGEPLLGREAIERAHQPVFTRWQKGTRMAVKPVRRRALGDDVISVLTVGGIGKGANIPFDKLQTYTFVKRDGRWQCAAFQNTRMSRDARREFNGSSSLLSRLKGLFQ